MTRRWSPCTLRVAGFLVVTILVSFCPAASAMKGIHVEDSEKSPWPVSTAGPARLADSELGDTCPGHDVVCDNNFLGVITPAGDVDYFTLPAEAGSCLSIVTGRAPGQGADTDTYMELLGQDCASVLAADDDSGPGAFAAIYNFTVSHTGSYVVRVRHFSPEATGEYRLIISCQPSAPINSTCATATPLTCGDFSIQGSTFCGGNDLAAPTMDSQSCTSFSTNGEDVAYSISLPAGGTLNLDYQSTADASVYILQDCNLSNCVAGVDSALTGDRERLSYTFPAGGTYYLVLDSFGTGSGGAFTLTGNLNCMVPVVPATWGFVKARFTDRP